MPFLTTLLATMTIFSVATMDVTPAPVFATDTSTEVAGPDQKDVKKANGAIVMVTAYTSEVGQTDSTPCIGADGKDLCVLYAGGEKICATNDHPMHAKLYIPGYGICTVRDRMNTRYTGTGRVDTYMGMDTPAARQWGARRVAVTRI